MLILDSKEYQREGREAKPKRPTVAKAKPGITS